MGARVAQTGGGRLGGSLGDVSGAFQASDLLLLTAKVIAAGLGHARKLLHFGETQHKGLLMSVVLEQLIAPGVELAGLALEVSNTHLDGAALILEIGAGIGKFFGGAAVVLHLEEGVKFLLAVGGG